MLTQAKLEKVKQLILEADALIHTESLNYVPKQVKPSFEARELVSKFIKDIISINIDGEEIPTKCDWSTEFLNISCDVLETVLAKQTVEEQCQALITTLIGKCEDKSKLWEFITRVTPMYIATIYQIPNSIPGNHFTLDRWEFREAVGFVDNNILWGQDNFQHNIFEAPNEEFVKYLIFKLINFVIVLLEDKEKACLKALEIMKLYRRVYWRGDAERVYHNQIIYSPNYIGMSLKAWREINDAASFSTDPHQVMNLANVFGQDWRKYVCRKTEHHGIKRLLNDTQFNLNFCHYTHNTSNESNVERDVFTAKINKLMLSGDTLSLTDIAMMVAGTIHGAAVELPSINHRKAKGLKEYLLQHDFTRNAPYTRLVSMCWGMLTDEEKKLIPKDAANTFIERMQGSLIDFDTYPESFKKEIMWLVPVLADECSGVRNVWDVFSEKVSETYEIYLKSQEIPLPKWTKISAIHNGYTAEFLHRSDAIGLFIGHYTGCCQHIGGGSAETCAIHAQQSPFAANFVIRNPQQEIEACSWVWEGSDGRVCFDNIEAKKTKKSNDTFKILVEQVASQIDAPLVTIGSKYSDIDLSEYAFIDGDDPCLPVDYPSGGYTDAELQVVIKQQMVCA